MGWFGLEGSEGSFHTTGHLPPAQGAPSWPWTLPGILEQPQQIWINIPKSPEELTDDNKPLPEHQLVGKQSPHKATATSGMGSSSSLPGKMPQETRDNSPN